MFFFHIFLHVSQLAKVDSIGSSRVEGESGGDSEVQRTMLELLNQLDGFEAGDMRAEKVRKGEYDIEW